MTVPFPQPCPPPRPPHIRPPDECDELEQLRETIEVQNRTIRYLLQNYEALLRKVESESTLDITWTQGAAQTIPANSVIPTGLWVNGNTPIQLAHVSHQDTQSIDPYDLFFTDGNDIKTGSSTVTIFPLKGSL